MTLGQRLRDARTARGLRVGELAALCKLPPDDKGEPRNVGPSHIAQIEGGKKDNPTAETAVALATALGCSLDWLLRGEGPPPDGVH